MSYCCNKEFDQFSEDGAIGWTIKNVDDAYIGRQKFARHFREKKVIDWLIR